MTTLLNRRMYVPTLSRLPPPPGNNAACTGMVESDGDNTSSMNDSNTPTVGESPSLKDVFSMLQVMASTMAQKNDLINVTNKIHEVEPI